MPTLEYYQPNEAETRLIKALRSGFFRQGRGVLQQDDELCCLGVACRISRRPMVISLEKTEISGDTYLFDNEACYLPPSVQAELGWATQGGQLTFEGRSMSNFGEFRLEESYLELSLLNDEGFTFEQIADIIEAGLVIHTPAQDAPSDK